MSIGITVLKSTLTGVFGVIKFGIQTVKNRKQIVSEIKDLDSAEIVEIVVQTVTEEIPAVVAEIKK